MESSAADVARTPWLFAARLAPAPGERPHDVMPERNGRTRPVVRSLRGAGLAALLGLPMLLAASLMADAPLAGPAMIASGYLAIASSAASGDDARATLMTAIILSALVAWPFLCFSGGSAELSGASLAAALVAPVFAAAPAVAHIALGARGIPNSDLRSRLPMPPSRMELTSVPPPPSRGDTDTRKRGGATQENNGDPCLTCDVREALCFAVRRARSRAEAKGMSLEFQSNAEIAAACDRQNLRRILHILTDCAILRAPAGGSISLSARRVRSIVLMQVRSHSSLCHLEDHEGNGASGWPERIAEAHALVERVGGTLMLEPENEGFALTVRLDLAPAGTISPQGGERGVAA
jgi:hypothetical protein